MITKQFEDLVKKRKNWVTSSKENNFDFDSILSGLYNNPSHFIYEILQNAEDAGASSITFNLSKDNLEAIHNAKKDFDFADVDGITGIGISTKKEDINKIGKFGVGFKSVFAITQSPEIESGNFHFQIENFVVPKSLEKNNKKGTIIQLPFNHPIRKQDEVFDQIEQKLQNIGLKTLLFLNNIKEIIWNTPNHNGHYFKDEKAIKPYSNLKKTSIISSTDNIEYFEEYLVFNNPIEIENKILQVEVAYKLESTENEKDKITSISDQESKLVVYFPTEKITYLNFIIQGPLKTTPNRENIPLDDKQNIVIINEIAKLVADSLPILKEIGFFTISFFELLPIENKNCDNLIYGSIFEEVKKTLLSDKKLLPTDQGGFANSAESLLARGKILTELLKADDIKLLFEKTKWLSTKITYDRTRLLRDYLINELDIREINFEGFADKITEEFLKTKTDGWFIKFYTELINRDNLFRKITRYSNEGVLFWKPIIRLENNDHCSIYDSEGNVQVFLPTGKKSLYKIVKPSIINNPEAIEFLTKRGISEPDIYAEIRKFVIPKYETEQVNVCFQEYNFDIKKIINALKTNNSTEKRKELINTLKRVKIINVINSVTKEAFYKVPSESYILSEELKIFFSNYDTAYFINSKFYEEFDYNDINYFFILIGCNSFPRRIEINADLSPSEKSNLRDNNSYTSDSSPIDYYIEGLDHILEVINLEKSVILWKFLLQSIIELPTWSKENFFYGKYNWFYYRQHTEKFEAKFKKQLCSNDWLFDKNHNQVCPSDISISELADEYTTENEDINVLEKVLNFKIDEIRKIEEETGGKFLTAMEKKEYEQFLAEKRINEEIDSCDSDDWIEEVSPDDVNPTIAEGLNESVNVDDLTYQNTADGKNQSDNENNKRDNENDGDEGVPPKKVGLWGERFVFNYLRNKRFSHLHDIENTDLGFVGKNSSDNFIEIKWLNKLKDIGKGYDFVVINDGVEIEYIEVKSTIKSNKVLHIITGTQWEFARQLFNSEEGDKYKIYAIKNVNSLNAKIIFVSNPIKLWKEGHLYAHPINIKV